MDPGGGSKPPPYDVDGKIETALPAPYPSSEGVRIDYLLVLPLQTRVNFPPIMATRNDS